MNTEYSPYSIHSSPVQPDVDLNALLELYFNPALSPFDIARRLGIPLPTLVAITQRDEFKRAVADLKALFEARSRDLATVAAHQAIQAVADGVGSLRAELTRAEPSPENAHAPASDAIPATPEASPPTPSARRITTPTDPRRALDSLVRALDRLQKAASPHPAQPRLKQAA